GGLAARAHAAGGPPADADGAADLPRRAGRLRPPLRRPLLAAERGDRRADVRLLRPALLRAEEPGALRVGPELAVGDHLRHRVLLRLPDAAVQRRHRAVPQVRVQRRLLPAGRPGAVPALSAEAEPDRHPRRGGRLRGCALPAAAAVIRPYSRSWGRLP